MTSIRLKIEESWYASMDCKVQKSGPWVCFYGGHSTGYKLGNHPKNIEPCAHRARTVRAPCAHRATTPPVSCIKDPLVCQTRLTQPHHQHRQLRSPPQTSKDVRHIGIRTGAEGMREEKEFAHWGPWTRGFEPRPPSVGKTWSWGAYCALCASCAQSLYRTIPKLHSSA